MAYIKKQRSRACTIFKNYPQCYMLEHEIGLLDMESDQEAWTKKKNKQKEVDVEKEELELPENKM